MYKTVKWTPTTALSSANLNQMVENDKENYIILNSASGPIIAVASMTTRFETMPGNIPTRIPALGLDPFPMPYTGWYKVHFSCPSARQEVINTVPTDLASGILILDGFHFVVTCRHSRRSSGTASYDPVTGASLFNVQENADAGNLGKVVARSAFVRSGISVPTAATGFIWLEKGDIFEWNVFTYVANNNYDLMGGDLRQYARIIVNDLKPSDERMGFGSPRMYDLGATRTPGTTADSFTSNQVFTSLSTSSTNAARKSHLVIQFIGTGGLPDPRYSSSLEKQLNYDKEQSILASGYEV